MIIQNMFEEDINRPINGVIKVDQDELGVIEQEVKEYVITKELKKHLQHSLLTCFLHGSCHVGVLFSHLPAHIGITDKPHLRLRRIKLN